MADPLQDLDAFLTSVESKLRAPFSSLELAKAVTTSAARDSLSPAEYLDRIRQTISRTDKSIQMRILIGLLGLDPSPETDPVIPQIVQLAQEAPKHEEWVRVIAGLIQHVMFDDKDENEASKLLEKTVCDIIQRVRKLEDETKDDSSPINTADLAPVITPFRYKLISPELRAKVLPDLTSNPHFQVQYDADVLTVDAKHEAQKAHDEQQHAKQSRLTTVEPESSNKEPQAVTPVFPGFQGTTKKAANSSVQHPKSSMFLPTKKLGRPVTLAQKSTGLHVRKAGASQALVGKSRQLNSATNPSLGIRGRAMGQSASKMKMIDVNEVKQLSKDDTVVPAAPPKKATKRKITASSTSKEAKTPKLDLPPSKTDPKPQPTSPKTPTTAANAAMASAALAAYQAAATAPPTQLNWQSLLEEKSNKLTDEDRLRVQQFFEHRFNPTPEQSTYKMKLHEERTADPKTGKPVKETYYLELDYNNYTSKQSKKIKRYD